MAAIAGLHYLFGSLLDRDEGWGSLELPLFDFLNLAVVYLLPQFAQIPIYLLALHLFVYPCLLLTLLLHPPIGLLVLPVLPLPVLPLLDLVCSYLLLKLFLVQPVFSYFLIVGFLS